MNADTTPAAAPDIAPLRIVLGLIAALAVGVLVVVSIGRLAGYDELRTAFDGAAWQWLALCLVGQLGVFAGYAGAFRGAVEFEGGPVIGRRLSLRIVLASFAMTQLVAAGGAAGLAITYWALRRFAFDRREAVTRLIGLNTAVYLVFATLGWVGALVAMTRGSAPTLMTLGWVAGVPAIVMAARWFTAPRRVASWDDRAAGRTGRALATGVGAAAWVRRGLADERGRELVGWAALYWIGDLVSLWAALRAFDASIAFDALVVAYATGYLAQAVPIPFIATGGVDAATTYTLSAVGVPVELALLGVVAHRLFAFWLPIGPGLWSAVRLTRDVHA